MRDCVILGVEDVPAATAAGRLLQRYGYRIVLRSGCTAELSHSERIPQQSGPDAAETNINHH